MIVMNCTLVCLIFLTVTTCSVNSHGRFLQPASRSSIWRFSEYAKYNPPPNYNDNELFCGAAHQASNPGDDCGVCGDPIGAAKPRDNEIGGKYYRGIITGRYSAAQVIDVEVELTRSHKGFMQWRLCTDKNKETQECFNKHLLQRADGQGSQVFVNDSGSYKTKLKLPVGVTCPHCIIQWNYRAGNDWGTCTNGTTGLGCGPQETFRGCSDVVIS